jgi:hypothetical protein
MVIGRDGGGGIADEDGMAAGGVTCFDILG